MIPLNSKGESYIETKEFLELCIDQLTIRTDQAADATQATLLVVPRVFGDTFSLQKYDDKLISIEKLSNDAGCEWKASVQDEVKNRIETEIVMVSSSGYQIVFPLTIE